MSWYFNCIGDVPFSSLRSGLHYDTGYRRTRPGLTGRWDPRRFIGPGKRCLGAVDVWSTEGAGDGLLVASGTFPPASSSLYYPHGGLGLEGRHMRRLQLLVLLAGAGCLLAACGGVLVGCGVKDGGLVPGAGTAGAVSSSDSDSSSSPAVQPPAWLLQRMKQEARNLGDPAASAWWTLTTADKAVTAEGDWPSGQSVANPDRAVYVTLLNGVFTNWIWSYPATASDPDGAPRPGPWVVDLIDAKSHSVDVEGNTAKRPDTSHLTLNAVELPDPAAQDVPVWLLEQAQHEAQNCGDPHPELAEWVASRKNEAELALTGDQSFEADSDVIVLALKGHFTDTKSFAPPGAPDPTGTWLMAMFEVHTHSCVGFGLGDQPLQLVQLGDVHSFSF
jgi:hypothetical protein